MSDTNQQTNPQTLGQRIDAVLQPLYDEADKHRAALEHVQVEIAKLKQQADEATAVNGRASNSATAHMLHAIQREHSRAPQKGLSNPVCVLSRFRCASLSDTPVAPVVGCHRFAHVGRFVRVVRLAGVAHVAGVASVASFSSPPSSSINRHSSSSKKTRCLLLFWGSTSLLCSLLFQA